jgi:hypothetical protein
MIAVLQYLGQSPKLPPQEPGPIFDNFDFLVIIERKSHLGV